jgi:hypothetical protein
MIKKWFEKIGVKKFIDWSYENMVNQKQDDWVFNPEEKLSEHFKCYEVSRSMIAERYGIDNTPTKEVIERAKFHAEHVLEPIRAHFRVPFSPTSWYRCPELERVVVGDATILKFARAHGYISVDHAWPDYLSRKSHPKGEATDLVLTGVKTIDLYNWIKENLTFDQLILEKYDKNNPYSGWVHVSSRKDGNRNQAFEIY